MCSLIIFIIQQNFEKDTTRVGRYETQRIPFSRQLQEITRISQSVCQAGSGKFVGRGREFFRVHCNRQAVNRETACPSHIVQRMPASTLFSHGGSDACDLLRDTVRSCDLVIVNSRGYNSDSHETSDVSRVSTR